MTHILRSIVAGAIAGCVFTAAAQAADETVTAQVSAWQQHEAKFSYMGFTSAYTCDGLEGKVGQILKFFGARNTEVRASGCPRGPNSLSHMIWVQVKFETLAAAAADTPEAQLVKAQWTPVSLDSQRPFFMGVGDCELVEDMKPIITANFSLRNLSYDAACTPHQVTYLDFRVKGEVLKSPVEHSG